MMLAAPLGLVALLGWAVPLAVHLARRTETRPTDFAALKWLRQKPRPRHRPRFDERPLLAVRLVLIALIALWLARPMLPGSADRSPVTAFAPGTVPGTGEGRRLWLAPGFPPVEQAVAGGGPVDSLIRQLDADLPAGVALTVVVPERLAGVDAERPKLSRAVTWRVVPGGPVVRPAMAAVPELVVRYAPERAGQLRWWRAVGAAWGRPVAVAGTEVPVPAGARHLVWLAGGPLPAAVRDWVAGGGTVLVPVDSPANGAVVWRDALGAPLAEAAKLGRGRIVRLTRDLTPAAMPELLEADFPAELRAVLAPLPAPSVVMARDYAPLTGGPASDEPVRDLRLPLALGIALLWLIERWLATARSRGVSP
ncbi:BatA domain-containing protein [Sphingomonas sp. KR1UV-12]|uniref:BatA domain-containing protein n=1 Tax=Sphingomonas aurea TaxID=3063994 RepID=A0ABT9EIW1_9SPHN|nr:BatA domain-containing protein [Sphingomonas sp. KR1UV-12]MDP1026743.1 BatA domain-containing protein [Sphingomonas sp. KR1UV-12]